MKHKTCDTFEHITVTILSERSVDLKTADRNLFQDLVLFLGSEV